jgi:hypothetical protein
VGAADTIHYPALDLTSLVDVIFILMVFFPAHRQQRRTRADAGFTHGRRGSGNAGHDA